MKYILLKENIQKARKILKSIDKDESNQSFILLKEIVGDHTGFLGLFTYLHFKKRVGYTELSNLLDNILQNRRLLKSLPKEVVNYENIEELEDDLTNAKEWAVYNREFVGKLTNKLRKEAKQDKELKNSYVHLEDKNKINLIENFISKVSRYKDYDAFKVDCIYFMNKNNQAIGDVIEKINNTKGIYLIYNELNIIIAEVFSKEASCLLGSKSWCISGNNGTHWETYAGLETGNKQYFIWNFNVSPTNIESQVGVTINKSGGQKTAHLKNDDFVQIETYLRKYEIPNVLTPLDIKKDINKIVDSLGITREVMGLLYDNDLINDYLHRIPTHYKYVYGLLSDEDTKDLPMFKKYIYSKDRYDEEVNSLFTFCDKFDPGDENIEDFIEEHKDNYLIKQIDILDFKDKIILLNKYDNITLENNGLYVLLRKEFSLMEGDDHSMDIDLGYTWDNNFDFEFKMDKDYYVETILDSYDEEYWELVNLSSHYGVLDDIDSDEFNYLSRYFTNEGSDKVIEYYKFLKKYTSHPYLLTKLNKIIEDAEKSYEEYSDSFVDIMDFISENIDKNFTDPYEHRSYFSEFWDEVVGDARRLASEDADEYEKTLKGEFDENDGTWKISLEDIKDSLRNMEEAFVEDATFTILDWMKSHPSSIRNMSTHYYDSPYDSTYLGLADVTSANERLVEKLDDVIDDSNSDLSVEDFENMKRYTDYLNKHYTPTEEEYKRGWRESDWYGYKKVIGDYTIIVPYTEISFDGYMNVYSIKSSIMSKIIEENEGKKDHEKFSYRNFNEKNEESLKERGIKFKKVSIELLIEEDIDPNQLKFKFEKLKTFTDFSQTK